MNVIEIFLNCATFLDTMNISDNCLILYFDEICVYHDWNSRVDARKIGLHVMNRYECEIWMPEESLRSGGKSWVTMWFVKSHALILVEWSIKYEDDKIYTTYLCIRRI